MDKFLWEMSINKITSTILANAKYKHDDKSITLDNLGAKNDAIVDQLKMLNMKKGN